MKTYEIKINTANRFQPAYWFKVAEVTATSKKEAKELYAKAIYGHTLEHVKLFGDGTDHTLRGLKISAK